MGAGSWGGCDALPASGERAVQDRAEDRLRRQAAPTLQKGLGDGNAVITDRNMDGMFDEHPDACPALWTAKANSVLTVHAEGDVRRLTPVECERPQGFPDGWTKWGSDGAGAKISDTQSDRAVGNAVTVDVVCEIVKRLPPMDMDKPPETASNCERALALAEKDLVAIPCRPLSKCPAGPWEEWQAKVPTPELQEEWFADARRNIAVICTGLVLFDVDDPAKLEVVLAQCGETPVMTRTPRGGTHLPFHRRNGVQLHNQVDVKGLKVDITTDGRLVLTPSSQTPDGRYVSLSKGPHEIADLSELAVAKVGRSEKG